MADFTLDEFQDYFRGIGNSLKLSNVENYLATLDSDMNYYSQVEDADKSKFLPEKYQSKQLEYLILYHFARYFLDGIMFTKQINISLSKYDEIKSVAFTIDKEIVDSFEINEKSQNKIESDYDSLRSLFLELGKSLLGDNFLINDFLKNN